MGVRPPSFHHDSCPTTSRFSQEPSNKNEAVQPSKTYIQIYIPLPQSRPTQFPKVSLPRNPIVHSPKPKSQRVTFSRMQAVTMVRAHHQLVVHLGEHVQNHTEILICQKEQALHVTRACSQNMQGGHTFLSLPLSTSTWLAIAQQEERGRYNGGHWHWQLFL